MIGQTIYIAIDRDDLGVYDVYVSYEAAFEALAAHVAHEWGEGESVCDHYEIVERQLQG